ncbi:MAG: hypothetical protein QXX76_03720 [Archaeoglobaceae archaeon]
MDLVCPMCGCAMKIIREEKGAFKRRFSEFEMKILVIRCPKCEKIGLLRLVPALQMENLEFPYEGSL